METATPVLVSEQDTAASRYKANGLILFRSTGQLVFMNAEARHFIHQFDRLTTNGIDRSHLVPEELHTVVQELIGQLIRCEHPKDCESIQVERLWFSGNQRVLLRGLVVPDAPVARNSHLLIVIEQLNSKSEGHEVNIQEQYSFTEREKMVIIYLMLGFTNKEIANRLNISEYTVKEHLKRIMHKTKTNTRTGLLARMVFPHHKMEHH
jgi:DNA-binding CsgD family transcriptional regulator